MERRSVKRELTMDEFRVYLRELHARGVRRVYVVDACRDLGISFDVAIRLFEEAGSMGCVSKAHVGIVQ